LWACNVASEYYDPTGLNFIDQGVRFSVEFRAWKTDEEKLSYLLFEWD
jgi:hypothetical protein